MNSQLLQYEKLGLIKFLEKLPENEKIKYQNISQINKDVVDEKTFWNSSFFAQQSAVYSQALADFQDSGINVSAGTCPVCGSKKTRAVVKLREEQALYFIICATCNSQTRR